MPKLLLSHFLSTPSVSLVLCVHTIQKICSSNMESQTDVASVTSGDLSAIEDEEVINKMVSH